MASRYTEAEIFEAVCCAIGDDGHRAKETLAILKQNRKETEQNKKTEQENRTAQQVPTSPQSHYQTLLINHQTQCTN